MDRLHDFTEAFEKLLERNPEEHELLTQGAALLKALVSVDDWLPEPFAVADVERYRQYLLYLDPQERFSVVSFVWGPGQETPIHNHTVWGLIGMLRGAEVEQHYLRQPDGALLPDGEPQRLEIGAVDSVSPQIGDLHRVSNAYPDRTSISIHVYEGNIGTVKRSVFEPNGERRSFISGYANEEQSKAATQ